MHSFIRGDIAGISIAWRRREPWNPRKFLISDCELKVYAEEAGPTSCSGPFIGLDLGRFLGISNDSRNRVERTGHGSVQCD